MRILASELTFSKEITTGVHVPGNSPYKLKPNSIYPLMRF